MTTYIQAPTMQSSAYISRTPMIIQQFEMGSEANVDRSDGMCCFSGTCWLLTLGCCNIQFSTTCWGLLDLRNGEIGQPCCCNDYNG